MYHRGMARMVRKQVYIEERQDRILKRRARELGVTEAELIRDGIDQLEAGARALPTSRSRALAELRRHWKKRASIKVPQTGRGWTREELYEERFARYAR